MRQGAFAWPDGHRVAVLVSLLLETWSEGKSPSYFPRTTPLRQGVKDIAGINWSRFGGKEGLWRLTRIVQDLRVPATLFCNGRAVEEFPNAITAFVDTGNTLAGHGYLQDQTLAYLSPEEERAAIRKTLDIIEKAAARRPTGWLTPIYGQSEHTLNFLVQEKLAWSSDALDSSMPYRQNTASGSIVMIPWSDFVDNRALRASPRIYFDVYKDTLDYLNAYEPGGLIHIGIHSHFGGRPLMAAAFRQILEYYREQKGVWFARPDEIANWMVAQNAESVSYGARFFQRPS
jgi:peptidoglycan/xylan/chitin deacetylase (PgdA/CDA1 family)